MTKILITGGAGFIGSRLARRLAPDHEVSVFDCFLPQVHRGNELPSGWLDGVNIIRGDVCDRNLLTSSLRNVAPSVVYHLASETGTGQSFDKLTHYANVNVMGTANLIEAIRSVGTTDRVVLAGSRSVYGEGVCIDSKGELVPAPARLQENMAAGEFRLLDAEGRAMEPAPTSAASPVAPMSIYASTKLMQEYMLRQAFWGTETEAGILRFHNVYGPGQSLHNPYTGVISIFCNQIREGKVLNIYEDGDIMRDFVFVDDVVDALVAIGTNDTVPRDVVDIGSGQGASILDVARMLLVLMGREPDGYRVTGDFRAGDIRYAVADITSAQRDLGWRPKTRLEDGLRAFVEWSVTSGH